MLQIKPINTGGSADISKMLDLFQNEMQRRRQMKDQKMQEENFAFQQQQRKQNETANAARYAALKSQFEPGSTTASSELYDTLTKYESSGVPAEQAEQFASQRLSALQDIDKKKAAVDVNKARVQELMNQYGKDNEAMSIISRDLKQGLTSSQIVTDIDQLMNRREMRADRAANKAERVADRIASKEAKAQELLEGQAGAQNDIRMLRNTGKNYGTHTVKIFGNDLSPEAQLISKGVLYKKDSKGYWVLDNKGKKKVWRKLTETQKGNWIADKFNAPGKDKILPSVINALEAGYTDFQNNTTKAKGKVSDEFPDSRFTQ